MFKRIEKFFEMGIYTEKQVRQFCDKKAITPEQFKEITGKEY